MCREHRRFVAIGQGRREEAQSVRAARRAGESWSREQRTEAGAGGAAGKRAD